MEMVKLISRLNPGYRSDKSKDRPNNRRKDTIPEIVRKLEYRKWGSLRRRTSRLAKIAGGIVGDSRVFTEDRPVEYLIFIGPRFNGANELGFNDTNICYPISIFVPLNEIHVSHSHPGYTQEAERMVEAYQREVREAFEIIPFYTPRVEKPKLSEKEREKERKKEEKREKREARGPKEISF